MEIHRIYRFGPFSLDAKAKVLLKGSEPVRLARKATEMLLLLVENAGRVVTREELFDALWPEKVVDDANLAQNIAVIRRALGVEHGERGYIETFSGRGYRFTGPVELEEPSAAASQHPADTLPQSHITPIEPFRWMRAALLVLGVLAAIGVPVIYYGGFRPSSPDSIRIAPLTRMEGKEFQPAISPDGSRVAFLWEPKAGGPTGLWVQTVGESAPRAISTGSNDCSSPAWSPDGRSIAFLRFGDAAGEIDIASADGSEIRVLSSVFPTRHRLLNRNLDWSPDGRWLAVDDTPSANQPFAIYLLSLNSGERKRMTQPEELSVGDMAPRFSPDGKTISFIRVLHRARQELFTVPAAGGAARQITSDSRQVSDQDWLTDGKTLVFASNREGEFRLWKAGAKPESNAPRYQATGIYGEFPIQFSISRKTGVLVYSVLQYDLDIWRLALDPRLVGESRWTRVVASTGQDASPQYSPDGQWICFRSDRTGEEELWVSRADGSNPVQITKGVLHPSVGHWSPDGHAIIFNHARSGEMFITEGSGTERWKLRPFGALGIHPIYSLDGSSIFAGTQSSIVRIPIRGGAPEELLNQHGISLGLSLDGKSLYFVHEATESTLWRLDLDSKKLVPVLDSLVPYCTSCWAVARDGIYYLGARPRLWSQQTIYFRDFATGRDQVVAAYPEPLPPIGSGPFSLSPDSKSLLTVRVGPSNSDVVRVEGFR